MFEVDVKKCDRTAARKEEDQLGFGVLIHSCIVHNDFTLPPHSCERRFFPQGKFTLRVKHLPHFKTSPTLKPLPLLQHHHHSHVHI